MAYHTGMKPQIVLDTNVLVAALRSRRGAAFHLVSLLPAAPFEINLSVPLVFEYEEVLPQHRHVMGLTLTDIAAFLDFLCSIAHLHEIFFLWRPTLTDPNDEMLLELAVKIGLPTRPRRPAFIIDPLGGEQVDLVFCLGGIFLCLLDLPL